MNNKFMNFVCDYFYFFHFLKQINSYNYEYILAFIYWKSYTTCNNNRNIKRHMHRANDPLRQ